MIVINLEHGYSLSVHGGKQKQNHRTQCEERQTLGLFWPEPEPANAAQSLGETESMEQVEAADFLLGPDSGSPTSPHLLQPLKEPKGRPVFYSSTLTFFILPPRE